MADHSCLVTAEVGGTTYQCREHSEAGPKSVVHHFALHWPACPAPWCRLKPGHRGLHDIPSGKPVLSEPTVTAELRALTVRQPWAAAIAVGGKLVENRSRSCSYRGLLAIHAGLAVDWDAGDRAWTAAGVAPYRRGMKRADWTTTLALGAVVAVAELADCHDDFTCGWLHGRDLCSPWAVSLACHLVLANVRPLAEPVPCKGKQAIPWRLPDDVGKAVRAQLEVAGDGR